MTTKTTKDWSEEEEEGDAAFSKDSITVRIPPEKHSTPTDVEKAPKKKETTLLFNIPKPPMETDTSATREPSMASETPPSRARSTSEGMATRAKATKPVLKTAQANNSLLSTIEAALEAVNTMSSKVLAKATVIKQLETAIEIIKEELKAKEVKQTESTTAFNEKDMKALDKKVDFIDNILTNEPPKSWAQVTATPTPMPSPATGQPAMVTEKKQQLKKARKERAQYEVTLTTSGAPASTNQIIASTPYKDITERLQKIVDKASLPDTPQLQGVNKLGRDTVRVQVKTSEGAKAIKNANIDWNEAYTGMKLYKPKYGVVVHGVPTYTINFNDDHSEIKDEWEKQNARNEIKITSITPLRKAKERHRPTAHQSIVVFTEDAAAADRCIKLGFFINSQKLKAERYAPHLHINQCYKCHGYGHRSTTCKKKEKCGKCAEDHPTAQCMLETFNCVNCEGKHEAWHIECPTRSMEGRRLATLRMETSPFYTA